MDKKGIFHLLVFHNPAVITDDVTGPRPTTDTIQVIRNTSTVQRIIGPIAAIVGDYKLTPGPNRVTSGGIRTTHPIQNRRRPRGLAGPTGTAIGCFEDRTVLPDGVANLIGRASQTMESVDRKRIVQGNDTLTGKANHPAPEPHRGTGAAVRTFRVK